MQTLRSPKKLRLADFEMKQTLGTGSLLSFLLLLISF